MLTRKLLYTASAILMFMVLAMSSTGAALNNRRTMYLTFNQPVRLPGVVLPKGTYTFELPDPDQAWNVVRVSSRDGRRVYFTAFTRVVDRPSRMPLDAIITFGEGPANSPTPITAWFPEYEPKGRQFIY